MAHKAPGKAFRQGLSIKALFRMFPDDETAERWFTEVRWPEGVRCPKCQSDNIQERATSWGDPPITDHWVSSFYERGYRPAN